jgi:hypothetical protein
MSLDDKSRTYKPTKTLEQLVAEYPGDAFLADRLAQNKAALALDPTYVPTRSCTELAREFPDNPGFRMMAGAEAEWKRNGGFGIFDHHLTPPHPEPAPGKYSVDVIQAVRRILAKMRTAKRSK